MRPALGHALRMITIDDVQAAAGRIAAHAHRTPLATSTTLDERVGGRVFLKQEQLQRGGAFKFRGACSAIASLSADARSRGVFTFSSGNHAQAIAIAARIHGIPATILMPTDAPASKVAATRGYGAEIITYDRYTEDRTALGTALAAERGLELIPPYDDERVIAGQGTTALEIFADIDTSIDTFIAPLGGGGLLSGCATVAKTLAPDARVIGVEPRDGNDFQQSLAIGERVRIGVPRTIADGLQADQPGEITFPIVAAHVSEVVTVTDDEIRDAMRFLFERCKILVEPSGAVGVAAMLAGRVDVHDQTVAVVLSGGNIDIERFVSLFS